ncbi:MAG: hypothetical protein U5L00_06510 [Desulfovermiculus sp.]|nr:hypothetical protein [Desulfovermiculus sp.]
MFTDQSGKTFLGRFGPKNMSDLLEAKLTRGTKMENTHFVTLENRKIKNIMQWIKLPDAYNAFLHDLA